MSDLNQPSDFDIIASAFARMRVECTERVNHVYVHPADLQRIKDASHELCNRIVTHELPQGDYFGSVKLIPSESVSEGYFLPCPKLHETLISEQAEAEQREGV